MKWNTSKSRGITALFVIGCWMFASPLYAYERLDDRQLDSVVAGAQLEQPDAVLSRIPFYSEGRHGKVEGEAIILPAISSRTSGSLQIQDGAQNHLNAMININAVNSPIQVLLNLNVNINSQVDVVKQSNLKPDIRW